MDSHLDRHVSSLICQIGPFSVTYLLYGTNCGGIDYEVIDRYLEIPTPISYMVNKLKVMKIFQPK